jgi:hypothetical protein
MNYGKFFLFALGLILSVCLILASGMLLVNLISVLPHITDKGAPVLNYVFVFVCEVLSLAGGITIFAYCGDEITKC